MTKEYKIGFQHGFQSACKFILGNINQEITASITNISKIKELAEKWYTGVYQTGEEPLL